MANNKNQQPDILQIIIIGFFKAIWWLISLPFRKVKFGVSKKGLDTEERNYITAKRLEIEKNLSSNNELELKHAVLEADKLVDYTMKQKGYSGETFADRLRSAEDSIPRNIYNDVWEGHKVRNKIAHEPDFRPANFECQNATKKLLEYLKTI